MGKILGNFKEIGEIQRNSKNTCGKIFNTTKILTIIFINRKSRVFLEKFAEFLGQTCQNFR